MSCTPFWPYCYESVKLDLLRKHRSKVIHIAVFVGIAIAFTMLDEHGSVAKFSWAMFVVRGAHLVGDILGDRSFSKIFERQ